MRSDITIVETIARGARSAAPYLLEGRWPHKADADVGFTAPAEFGDGVLDGRIRRCG